MLVVVLVVLYVADVDIRLAITLCFGRNRKAP